MPGFVSLAKQKSAVDRWTVLLSNYTAIGVERDPVNVVMYGLQLL